MKKTARQKLFNYFAQEYNLQLLDSDFNELDEYAREAEAWKPYPENKPTLGSRCWCTVKEYGDVYVGEIFYHENGFGLNDDRITAWMLKPVLPAPYQEMEDPFRPTTDSNPKAFMP